MADHPKPQPEKKKAPSGSGRAVFTVQKVTKKGAKEPPQIVITRESVSCVTPASETSWTLPSGSIIRFSI